MKYLKIENNKGYYLNLAEEGEWFEIDKINKEHLLSLMEKVIEDEFDMDEYSEELLQNKAHQIIYRNLYGKFLGLKDNKSRFKDESEMLFSEELESYKAEVSDT